MESDVDQRLPECYIIANNNNSEQDLNQLSETANQFSRAAVQNPTNKTNKNYCDYCKSNFSTKKDLVLHQKTHRFICIDCDMTFYDYPELESHMMTAHTHNKAFVCEYCSKTFPFDSMLQQHRRSHLGDKPYKCDDCGKFFSRLFNLQIHQRRHTGEGLLSCPSCPQTSFSHPSNLNKHIQRLHSNIRPHVCTFCCKSFSDLSSLNRHCKTHQPTSTDDNEPTSTACKFSKKSFSDSDIFIEHVQTHPDTSKPYYCDLCSKSFHTPKSIAIHLKAHQKEKVFTCQVCTKSFNQSGHLNRHLKCHSENAMYICKLCTPPKSNTFPSIRQLLQHQQLDHDAKLPHVCKYCQKVFAYQSLLEQHLRKHTGEKPFSCHFCNKNFARQFNLKVHLRRHKITDNTMLGNSYSVSAARNIGGKKDFRKHSVPNSIEKNDDNNIDANFNFDYPEHLLNTKLKNSDENKNTHNNSPFEHVIDHTHSLLLQPDTINHRNLNDKIVEDSIAAEVPYLTTDDNLDYRKSEDNNCILIDIDTDVSSEQNMLNNASLALSDCDINITELSLSPRNSTDTNSDISDLSAFTYEISQQTAPSERRPLSTPSTNAGFDLETIDLTKEIEEMEDNSCHFGFICKYCNTVFLNQDHLNEHIKLHRVTQPYVCGYCQKSFRYSQLLTKHIQSHAKQINRFCCKLCPQRFASLISLVLHKEIHKRPKSFRCEFCGQHFSTFIHLNLHKKKHYKSLYKDKYQQLVAITNHSSSPISTKRKQGNNLLYSCQYCGKVFRYLSLLKQHQHRHTGEKPFSCKVCQKSFARLFNLKVHQKQHQKESKKV